MDFGHNAAQLAGWLESEDFTCSTFSLIEMCNCDY